MLTSLIHKNKQRYQHWLNEHFSVQALNTTQASIDQWFRSPQGQHLLSLEQQYLDDILPLLFGYYLMQMSVLKKADLASASPASHRFAVSPVLQEEPTYSAVVDYQQLPFAHESIDIAVLHHALDFSPNPQQLLREVTRSVIPNGHIIIIGFNPFSLMGLLSPLGCLMRSSSHWRHQHLRIGRLDDWFQVLDLEMLYCQRDSFSLPVNARPRAWMTKLGKTLAPGCGNFYVLVARKSVLSMTPIKKTWKTPKTLIAWGKRVTSPIPKHTSPTNREACLRNNEKN